jgi:ATP synthase protein I
MTEGEQMGRDPLSEAARRAADRAERAALDPEPSVGRRLGQIGALGWIILVPTLGALFLGRWIDHRLGSGIFFSAPLLLVGATLGFWSAWRWMHRQAPRG